MSSRFSGTVRADAFSASGITIDSSTATASSNAATMTTLAGVYTTASLTTAAGAAATAQVITISGLAATDVAIASIVGGTNTTVGAIVSKAVVTANTLTLTLANLAPSAALNGTLIVSFLVIKASEPTDNP